MNLPKTSKYGLYIHIPFCKKGKCPYCDFASIPIEDPSRDGSTRSIIDKYIESLEKEIILIKKAFFGSEEHHIAVETIYIGGGTPTLLMPYQVDYLLKILERHFDLSALIEASIEANPETIREDTLAALKGNKINRISIGVQTFNDKILANIGRRHSRKEAIESILIAKKTFNNINIDLMFGLPYQDIRKLKEDLEIASSLDITHISAYELTLKDNSGRDLIFKGLPNEDTIVRMYRYISKFLKDKGFIHYEISNFAKDGFFCRHNLKYWQGEGYIGIGLSAGGLIITEPREYSQNIQRDKQKDKQGKNHKIQEEQKSHSKENHYEKRERTNYYSCRSAVKAIRYKNTEDIERYFHCINSGKLAVEELYKLDSLLMAKELIITALRTKDGIERDDFIKKTGLDLFDILEKKIDSYVNLGVIEKTQKQLALTEKGFILSNEILAELISTLDNSILTPKTD